MNKNKYAIYFLLLALLSLFISTLIGVLSSFQYLFPELLKETFHFAKLRPIHVVSSVSWIVLGAIGSIYYYISNQEKTSLFSFRLVVTHFYLFLLTGLAIYASILIEKIGGREFFVFAPMLMIPILIGWIFFGINYFKTIRKKIKNWPVYYWMWGTGTIFMIFHLMEAHFWLIPSFRENYIRDLVVQWKSVGSFVGSWNQLVYGISIYLMTKIKGDDTLARGKLVFFFYFLGLANLMFGWAHHTYIIPSQPWVRIVAYAISMTEWIILFRIIYGFMKSLPRKKQQENSLAYRFLLAADIWIFLNLFLALLLSIPAINYYTHGTHITVAHTMGTMIGINTMILMASIWYIISKIQSNISSNKWVVYGYQILNGSLLLFLISFVIAGIKRSKWMYENHGESFAQMQSNLHGVYTVMILTGMGVFVGLLLVIITALNRLFK
jgi:nitric oxide reductase subunit B